LLSTEDVDAAEESHLRGDAVIHRREILIEWGDCDPATIVYFPNYFVYGDACTAALFASAGMPKPELLKNHNIAGIPLVDAHGRFFAASKFGQTLTVESRITAWGRSSFSVLHRFLKGDQLAVEISEKRVWAIHDTTGTQPLKSSPIPQEVKDRLPAMPAEPEK
jgi:4-hydroxybenzoyl-CoA thioesterase